MSKYKAVNIEANGEKYKSKKELSFHSMMKQLYMAEMPSERVVAIQREVRYDIVVNNQNICFYKLDFLIRYADGHTRYVDVKGYKKGAAYQHFRLKKKLVEALYNIKIEEV